VAVAVAVAVTRIDVVAADVDVGDVHDDVVGGGALGWSSVGAGAGAGACQVGVGVRVRMRVRVGVGVGGMSGVDSLGVGDWNEGLRGSVSDCRTPGAADVSRERASFWIPGRWAGASGCCGGCGAGEADL